MVDENSTILECPVHTDDPNRRFLSLLFLYTEGVALVACTCVGITSNFVFGLILCRKEPFKSFNVLLVSLSAFGSLYLMIAVSQSLRKAFGVTSEVQGEALTASVLMLVVISLERLAAVQNPIHYNGGTNDAGLAPQWVAFFVVLVSVALLHLPLPKLAEVAVEEVWDTA